MVRLELFLHCRVEGKCDAGDMQEIPARRDSLSPQTTPGPTFQIVKDLPL